MAAVFVPLISLCSRRISTMQCALQSSLWLQPRDVIVAPSGVLMAARTPGLSRQRDPYHIQAKCGRSQPD